MGELICVSHCEKWWGKGHTLVLPSQLPVIHTGMKLIHHQLLSVQPTMGVMAEVCNLVSGFKVGLPEETEFKVKIQRRRERKRRVVPPDWTTDIGDLRGGSILNLRY